MNAEGPRISPKASRNMENTMARMMLSVSVVVGVKVVHKGQKTHAHEHQKQLFKQRCHGSIFVSFFSCSMAWITLS